MEVWLPILGWSWYQVSNFGHVRSLDRAAITKNNRRRFYKGQILNPWKQGGYYFVDLSSDESKEPFAVHILVCTAFHGDCPEGEWCRHLDGNSLHNLPDNLMWGTPNENSSDNIRNGVKVGLKPGSIVPPVTRELLKQAALRRWSRPDERKKQAQRTKDFHAKKK